MVFRGNGGNGVSRVWGGGGTGHRKLISRGDHENIAEP